MEDFQEMVSIWEAVELTRETIAERFGGKQLDITADICEFLLCNLTPLEQEKIFVDLRHRINKTMKTNDLEVLQSWKKNKLEG